MEPAFICRCTLDTFVVTRSDDEAQAREEIAELEGHFAVNGWGTDRVRLYGADEAAADVFYWDVQMRVYVHVHGEDLAAAGNGSEEPSTPQTAAIRLAERLVLDEAQVGSSLTADTVITWEA